MAGAIRRRVGSTLRNTATLIIMKTENRTTPESSRSSVHLSPASRDASAAERRLHLLNAAYGWLLCPATAAASPAPQLMKKTILLADDDASIRTMLGRLLESEQYTVVLAANGAEAASQFITKPPHLVLLDLNMPVKDGWETWRLMCHWRALVPVIVITARSHQYEEAVRNKVDAMMEKPLDLHLLLQAIQTLLEEPRHVHAARLGQADFKTVLLKAQPRHGIGE